jgi:outer membrane receptor protein involved in Fe transport
MRWSALVLLVTLSAPLAARQIEPVEQQVALGGPRFLRGSDPNADVVDPASVPALQRRVSLTARETTLAGALGEITRQTGVRFLLSRDVVPLEKPVRMEVSGLSLAAVMTELLLNAHVDVAVVSPRELALVRRREAMVQDSGAVVGRVTDAKTRAPLAGATVVIAGTPSSATTGDDGSYRIAGVPEGTYTVRARYVGYSPGEATVTVGADLDATADFALVKSAQVLDEVVTTGTVVPTEVKALPSPISVITADQIERQHPFMLTSILRQAVPTAVAFNNYDNPTATQISVRGASSLNGAGSMKIFVDGVEATSYDFTPVDPASIDRIEVVRGPQAATMYGADAAGGVIQIFTKRGGAETRPRVDLKAALGLRQTPYEGFRSVPRQEYSGSVHGGGEGVSYNLGGGYNHVADYLPDGETSRQSASSIYGGMHVTRGILEADLSARYYDNESPQVSNPLLRNTGYLQLTPPRYMKASTLDETVSARLAAAPTTWWHNQLTVGIARHTTHIAQSRPRFTTPADSLLSVSNSASRKVSLGYNASVVGAVGSHMSGSLTVGFDHYAQDVDLLTTSRALNVEGSIQSSPPGSLSGRITRKTNTGYFVQAQLGLRDAIFATAGVRAEDNSTFGTNYGKAILPRIGLTAVRDIGATTVKVRASYGQALRTPSVGAAVGIVSATGIGLANPLLAAETQEGWDGGFDLVFGDRASLSVTGFAQTARDLIALIQVATEPLPTSQYQNIGRVSNRGLELEATLTPAPWLAFRAQYGYVHSRVEEVGAAGGQVQVGDAPVSVPSHTAGAALTLTPLQSTTINAGLTYVGSFRGIDWVVYLRCLANLSAPACPESFLSTFSLREFNVTYPGFAKFNASVTHSFNPQLEAFLAIDNLTNNQAYEFGNLSPIIGRTTMLGLEVTY